MAGPLRILMVSSSLEDDGGLPVAVGQLSMALADLGHRVEITGQHCGALATVIGEASRRDGVCVTPFRHPWHLFGQAAAARQVRRLVRERCQKASTAREAMVVHVHGVWALPAIAGASAARAAGARVVVHPHGMLRAEPMRKSRLRKTLVFNSLVRPMLANSDVVQATTAAEAHDLVRLMPSLQPKTVPLGIGSLAIQGARKSEGFLTAGYMGRILPIKNLDTLLRAWAAATDSRWRLHLAGPGDPRYIQTLQSLARSLGLGDRVVFQPAVPHTDLGQFLTGLDLFIHPSKSESFALGVGEALAAGVPVITTTFDPWSPVGNHDCGWTAQPTQAGLEAAIRTATTFARKELELMGQRGSAWIKTEYGWPAIARRYVSDLYTAAPEPHG